MKKQNTRRGFTQIKWVGQALPDNAPAQWHLAAFTLIELLVVVLIIGILTAVAVPRYQKAVEKSKATQGLAFIKAAYAAQTAYDLSNGKYAATFNELDLDFPFTGSQKAHTGYYITDTLSNKDWSLQLESRSNLKNILILRITGDYKGAGVFADPNGIRCTEQHTSVGTGTILFDKNPGDYCIKVLGATFEWDSGYHRLYTLP